MAGKTILEELENRAGQLSEIAVQVGNQISGYAKKKTEQLITENDIRTIEKKQKALFAELGKLYYEAIKAETEVSEEKDQIMVQIDSLTEEIEEKKAALDKIAKRTACPKCGKFVEEATEECPKCGHKFSETDEAEEETESAEETVEEVVEEAEEAVAEAAEEAAEVAEEAAEEAAETAEVLEETVEATEE